MRVCRRMSYMPENSPEARVVSSRILLFGEDYSTVWSRFITGLWSSQVSNILESRPKHSSTNRRCELSSDGNVARTDDRLHPCMLGVSRTGPCRIELFETTVNHTNFIKTIFNHIKTMLNIDEHYWTRSKLHQYHVWLWFEKNGMNCSAVIRTYWKGMLNSATVVRYNTVQVQIVIWAVATKPLYHSILLAGF